MFLVALLLLFLQQSTARHCQGDLVIGAAFYSSWTDLEGALAMITCSFTLNNLALPKNNITFMVMVSSSLTASEDGRRRMAVSEQKYNYKSVSVSLPTDTYLAIYRWVKLHEILVRGSRHCNVLAMDLRDSIFQNNPFAHVHDFLARLSPINNIPRHPYDYLLLAHEGMSHLTGADEITINDSGVNKFWLLNQCWGEWAVEERMAALSRPISCSGTVMGSRRAMIEYTALMMNMWEQHPRCYHKMTELGSKQGGMDQGTHNVLLSLYMDNFTVPVYFPPNGRNRILFTLGIPSIYYYQSYRLKREYVEENVRLYDYLDDNLIMLRDVGAPPSVVHQYDRDKGYLHKLKYQLSSTINCTIIRDDTSWWHYWLSKVMGWFSPF